MMNYLNKIKDNDKSKWFLSFFIDKFTSKCIILWVVSKEGYNAFVQNRRAQYG